jgi:hypothetical protein
VLPRRSPYVSIGALPARSSSSVRHAVLDAYESLSGGDAQPLIGLLSADVEWIEAGVSRSTKGRTAVAALLEHRSAAVRVQGIVVRSNALVLSFKRPWWREHPQRIRERFVRACNGSFAQSVVFGSEIERIECRSAWGMH